MEETPVELAHAVNVAPLRVGIIGCGQQGERHAAAFLGAGCEIRWLADLDREREERLARKLGEGVQTYHGSAPGKRLEEMEWFQDSRFAVDIMSIASYDSAHARQVSMAFQAGVHVFCEKPLCQTLRELAEIRQQWEERQRVGQGPLLLMCNFPLRTLLVFHRVKRMIEEGEFGELYSIEGEYLYGRLKKITQGWRAQEPDYSPLIGGGIHLVDLVCWLTGMRPESVTTVSNHLCTQGTAFRYDDYVAATYQYSSGLIARITANFGCVHPHEHRLRIYGTKGTFLYEKGRGEIRTSRTARATIVRQGGREERRTLIPQYVQAVRSGQQSRAMAIQEFAVMAMTIAGVRGDKVIPYV